MSRRCTCARLFTAFRADPRLRSLPWATRAFFLLLGEAMAASETPGVLGFGSAARVSLLVSVPETEVETQMETLMAEGLLVSTETGGLMCPLLAGPPPKVRAAQENGRKGGRPRKNESPEAARLRRSQPALAFAIPGGAGETQGKPKPETPYHDDDSSNSSGRIIISRASEALSLAREVAALAGMDPARSDWHARDVQGWLAEGASPQLVREVVADVMTRCRTAPSGLRYFSPAIRRALAERQAEAVVAAPPSTPRAEWSRAFEAHLDAGGLPNGFPLYETWLAARTSALRVAG